MRKEGVKLIFTLGMLEKDLKGRGQSSKNVLECKG